MKISKGDFIPPKYAERTWRLQYICSDSYSCTNISKELADTWVSKMTTPEKIVVTSDYQTETAIIDGQGMFLTILGVDDNYFDVWRHKFIRGRPLNRQEIADAVPVAVLDKAIAEINFGKNVDPIGKQFEFNSIQYKVVGIIENTSFLSFINVGGMPPNVIVPLDALKTFNQSISRRISFTAKNKASVAEMQEEFKRLLNETNTAEDNNNAINKEQQKKHRVDSKTLEKQIEIIPDLGLLMVCLILMLIPALNILSLNVCKSYDRSEEIAIRRAFGAPVFTIFGQLFF